MTRRAISKRVTAGRLHRVHRGVYSVGHRKLSREARWLAAVLALGPGAALSHLDAAILWNIWIKGTGEGVSVVAPRQHRARFGIDAHSSRTLLARDVTRRDGIPVTTVARTALDLGDVLSAWRLAWVLHEADFRRRLNRRALADVIRRNPGRRATTVLRRALALNETGSAGAKSELEEAYAQALLDAGIPVLLNVPVPVEGDAIRVDFHWVELRLVVEVDGSPHDRVRTKREDRANEVLLRAAGWDVARFGPGQEQACVEYVRERFRRAAASAPTYG